MAKLSWKRQLVLAATLFTLGTLAYWLEYKRKPEKEAAEEQSKKLFQIKDAQIESIQVTDGKRSFNLVCSDQGAKLCKPGDNAKWELTEPNKLRADDANANALVSALNNLTVTDSIDLKEETPEKRANLLQQYGLDQAARAGAGVKKVAVKSSKGMTTVYLGQTHPIGESIFALMEQGGKPDETKVYLLPNYFKSNLDHDLTYWRDKKLITMATHEVESFRLLGSKANLSAERKDGQWTIHSGPAFKEDFAGDIENIDSLLSGATFLTARNFAADKKTDARAKAALAGAGKVLTLTLQKEKGAAKEAPEPVTVTLFQKKGSPGKLYATVSTLDPVFELDSGAKDRLDKGLKDLRLAKLVTSMERFTAKKLEFSGKPIGDKPLTIASQDGKWMIQPEKKDVASDKVQAFLDKITGNRIKDYLQGPSVPKGEEDGVKFVMSDDKTEGKRQFVFWRSGGKLFARDLLSKRNEAYLLDPSIQNDLPWDRNFFDKTAAGPAPGAPPDAPKAHP